MSQPIAATKTSFSELELIEFEVCNPKSSSDKNYFGINISKVREIIRIPPLTSLPNMHPSVKGIFTLRGDIYPCIDLGTFLYGEEIKNSEGKMIISEFSNLKISFIVSNVKTIHRVT